MKNYLYFLLMFQELLIVWIFIKKKYFLKFIQKISSNESHIMPTRHIYIYIYIYKIHIHIYIIHRIYIIHILCNIWKNNKYEPHSLTMHIHSMNYLHINKIFPFITIHLQINSHHEMLYTVTDNIIIIRFTSYVCIYRYVKNYLFNIIIVAYQTEY